MHVDDISVEVRDKTLKRIGIIDSKYLDIKAVKRHLGVGEWHLTLPQEHKLVPTLWTPGAGIIITLRDKVWMSGPTKNPSFESKAEDPVGSIVFSGVDDNILLADATAWPLPGADITAQTVSNDVRTGAAETIMKQFVNYNIGPGAPAARRGLLAQLLTIETDQGRGTSTTRSPRFTNLGDLLADIGLYAGLGFQIIQVGSNLQFQVYSIRDQHLKVQFDIENGSISDETIQVSAPSVTRAIVAGQGEGADRQLLMRTSTDSLQAEADWGRKIEQFIDQRNTNVVAELQQSGDKVLIESGFTAAAVKAIPADDTTRQYITDWDIGDKVTVIIQGQPTTTTTTEASLVANKDGVAIAAALGDVSGFNAASAMGGQIDDTARRVAALEANTEVTAAIPTLATTVDLNTLVKRAKYYINGLNPNSPSLQTAIIEIEPNSDGSKIFQTVTAGQSLTAGVGTVVFTRMLYAAGTWSSWRPDRPIIFDNNSQLIDYVSRLKPNKSNPLSFLYHDATTMVPIPRGTSDGVVYYDVPGGNFQPSYAWVYPTLQGSWTDYAGYTPHRAIKTSAGIVLVRGLVKGGAVGSLIMTLPVGMRPAQTGLYPVICSGNGTDALALVKVDTAGGVYFAAGQSPAGWLSLSGIQFPSSDVAPNSAWSACTYLNSFSAYGDVTYGTGAQSWKDSLGTIWFRGMSTRAAGAPTVDTPMLAYGTTADAPASQVHIPGGGGGGFTSHHITNNQMYWKTGSTTSMAYMTHCGQFVVPQNVGSWATYTLANGWVNYGGGFPVAQIWRRVDGLLINRGLIDVGTGSIPGTPIPSTSIGPNYRNSTSTDLGIVNSGNAWGRIDYSASGMGVLTGLAAWLSLDGLLGFVEG